MLWTTMLEVGNCIHEVQALGSCLRICRWKGLKVFVCEVSAFCICVVV